MIKRSYILMQNPIVPSISAEPLAPATSATPVVPPTPIQSATAPTPQVKHAGFWIRFVAIMVDGLVINIAGTILAFIFGMVLAIPGSGNPEKIITIFAYVVAILGSWAYYIIMTHRYGATLGKMLVGITVKSDDYEKLSLGRIILRETIGKIISAIIICIGYIMAAFTERKQALHDKMAHSVVVYKDPTGPHGKGLVIGVIIAVIVPVIAVIGIMASVVLTSLEAAREKASDAALMSRLTFLKSNAETYHSEMGSYSQSDDCLSGMFSDPSMELIMNDIGAEEAMCYAAEDSYAVSAQREVSKDWYCVDSSGYSGKGMAVVALDDGVAAKCVKAYMMEK